MKDFYDTNQKKILHFVIGFGMNLVIAVLHFYSYFLLAMFISSIVPSRVVALNILGIVLMFVIMALLQFILIRYFFRSGKRYIAIGMLSALFIPLLVTGFCSMVFMSAPNFN